MAELAVAILTYRRPLLLEDAVRGVLEEVGGLAMDAEVIVVDNDPERSAEWVLERFPGEPVRYVAEATAGIAAARNAALDAAANSRLLAFMDDDEVPVPGWLGTLVAALHGWSCEAVAGPTLRLLDDTSDEWVRASRFFEHVPRPTGERRPGAACGNLLIDLAAVRQLGVRFDERFGTSGGEDTMFSRQLVARGGVIRWCEDAVTTEAVAVDRATRSWVLQRERRIGNSWSRVHLALAAGWRDRMRTRLRLGVTTGALLVRGVFRCGLGVLRRDLACRARGERELVRGYGVLTGGVGVRVDEYRRG